MYKIMINGEKYKNIDEYCNEKDINIEDFNEPVTILVGVTDCSYMFSSCYKFNQSVTIPDGVTDCRMMFLNCYIFNKPVTIPNSVKNCTYMFSECHKFNQPVTIPDSAEDCVQMFSGCYDFNQEIIIPANCSAEAILMDCPLYTKNIKYKYPVKIKNFGRRVGSTRKFYIKMNDQIFISTNIDLKNIKVLKNDIIEYNPVSHLLIYRNNIPDKRIFDIIRENDNIKYYTINNKTYEVNVPYNNKLLNLNDTDKLELKDLHDGTYKLIVKSDFDDVRLAKFLLNVNI